MKRAAYSHNVAVMANPSLIEPESESSKGQVLQNESIESHKAKELMSYSRKAWMEKYRLQRQEYQLRQYQ